MRILLTTLFFGALLIVSDAGRGGRGRGKGKGKNLLPFGNVMEYSLVQQNQRHPKIYEERRGRKILWSKVEIDPAAMGDQGIYTCMTHNNFGLMVKNFKCEYTY